MQIRPMVDADLPVIRAWMDAVPEAPAWSDDDLAALVNVPACDQRRIRKGWIAEDGAPAITGFVVATALSPECELEFVLVPPHARRQGIAVALIQTVFAWARGMGAQEIWLELRQSNTRALRLYERCGFVVAGHRPGYYANPTEDAVLMRCRIDYERGDTPV